MKQVLVVGGGGMVGQKLAFRLATDGLSGSRDNRVVLVDIGFPENGAPADERIQGDFADAALSARLAALRSDPIFLLAAMNRRAEWQPGQPCRPG